MQLVVADDAIGGAGADLGTQRGELLAGFGQGFQCAVCRALKGGQGDAHVTAFLGEGVKDAVIARHLAGLDGIHQAELGSTVARHLVVECVGVLAHAWAEAVGATGVVVHHVVGGVEDVHAHGVEACALLWMERGWAAPMQAWSGGGLLGLFGEGREHQTAADVGHAAVFLGGKFLDLGQLFGHEAEGDGARRDGPVGCAFLGHGGGLLRHGGMAPLLGYY